MYLVWLCKEKIVVLLTALTTHRRQSVSLGTKYRIVALDLCKTHLLDGGPVQTSYIY